MSASSTPTTPTRRVTSDAVDHRVNLLDAPGWKFARMVEASDPGVDALEVGDRVCSGQAGAGVSG
ncbi:MAG TPA: hypothetical protein VF137_05150 [Candidatus Dormibacteraeota bacterium]